MPSAPRLALALVLAALAAGCDDADESQEADDRVIVKLAFDEVTYVDAGIATRKLVERVRQQSESIFTTLRRADVMITAKKQVEVDLGQLEKDPVTVVDLGSGITRTAVRVRYHFVGLALAPKALAARAEVPMAALHTTSPGHFERVIAVCSANGEQERAAVLEPWTVYDASLTGCVAAARAEQAAIDEARKELARPEREVVATEFERVFVPVTVRLQERRQRGEAPAEGEHVEGVVRSPAGGPGVGGGGPGGPYSLADRAREREFEDDEDERALQRMARPMGGASGPRVGSSQSWGSAVYLEHNFTLLYVVGGAATVLLLGWKTTRRRR